jgi:hypothetical protein
MTDHSPSPADRTTENQADRDARRAARAREIRARLDAADVEGPWEVEPDEHGSRLGSKTRWVGYCPDCGTTAQFDHGDADLIANAPTDLAYLLEENWRLDQLARVTEAMGLAKIAELNARVGELEGQLAKAERDLEEQRWYGEQLQTALDSCSGNHLEIEEYPGEVSIDEQ